MPWRKIYFALLYLAIGFFGCSPDNGEIAGRSDEFVYDYSLVDINPNSATDGETLIPGYFENQITLHYFWHQN